MTAPNRKWWGSHPIAEGQGTRFRIGSLTFEVLRLEHEWRIAWDRGTDPVDRSFEIQRGIPAAQLGELPNIVKVGVSTQFDAITLSPGMPDRSVVARPGSKLSVAAGEEVAMYVSTPLVVRTGLGAATRIVHEVSTFLLQETWFGPTSVAGELAYALRPPAEIDPEALPSCPHRAITEVRILNRASTKLDLERVNLPLSSLGLYASVEHGLRTDLVVLERTDEQQASVRVLDAELGPAFEPLIPHVRGPERWRFVRAMELLFH